MSHRQFRLPRLCWNMFTYCETNRASFSLLKSGRTANVTATFGFLDCSTNCTNHLNQCLPKLIVRSCFFVVVRRRLSPLLPQRIPFFFLFSRWLLVHFSPLSPAYLRQQTVYRISDILFFFLPFTWNLFIRFTSVCCWNGIRLVSFQHFFFLACEWTLPTLNEDGNVCRQYTFELWW